MSIFFVSLTPLLSLFFFFFLNDPAPTEIYPLPLHAALPISGGLRGSIHSARALPHNSPSPSKIAVPASCLRPLEAIGQATTVQDSPMCTRRSTRSEEHTSELQSPCNLVCRLLLEKKKTTTNN